MACRWSVVARRLRAPSQLFLSMIATAGAALAADDPFIGKWLLDRDHSKYQSGDVPQSMTITMEAADQGVHYRSETTFNNGGHTASEYTASYDGTLATVVGPGGVFPPVSLKLK
jgi:hypothetical protein